LPEKAFPNNLPRFLVKKMVQRFDFGRTKCRPNYPKMSEFILPLLTAQPPAAGVSYTPQVLGAGLPDGIFAYQKSQSGFIMEGLVMDFLWPFSKLFGRFVWVHYGHLV
jgi:hypothetical protein